MNINIKFSIAKTLYKEAGVLKNLKDWRITSELAKPIIPQDEFQSFKIDLTAFTKAEIKKLRVQLSSAVSNTTLDRIDRWIEILDSPDATTIPTVKAFKEAVVAYLKNQKTKWLWHTNTDGVQLAWLVDSVDYRPAQRYSPEHVTVTMVRGTNEGERVKSNDTTKKDTVSFGSYEIYGPDEDDKRAVGTGLTYFSKDDLEEFDPDREDEDDDDKPKKKVVTRKKKARKLAEIFSTKGYFFHTDALENKYLTDDELYIDLQFKQIGKQYITNRLGYWEKEEERYYYSSVKVISLIEDGRPCKLVIDHPGTETKERQIVFKTSEFGMQYLPFHHYVMLYDITKHRKISVHVEYLEQYKYNKKMLDRLVLPENVKTLVNALVDGEAEMEGKDIVDGKSGGIIILCAGPPGTGKSLTGEVYSEYVEKPLYQIQSSQLGIGVDDIEKNLADTLRRAERWNCILMIDEADTYVYARGQDITQNCIVGTFLRLLEYYNGILFLTTNRSEIVDDAIMSRVTVSIDYSNPDKASLIKIWKGLSESFALNLTDANIEKITDEFSSMSGRDVRNCLKLLKKYYRNNEPITVDSINFIKPFIPAIKEPK